MSSPRHNLPAQPTPLIGRDQDVASAKRSLLHDGVRLLTLTGPGGSGKTRLALAVAEDVIGNFADGAWLVDLTPLRDPALVVTTVARTLGVQEGRDRPIFENLLDYLRDRQVLLILDNCEHVLEAAPRVAELLTTCRRGAVLATSREPLHLRWEHEQPVPPLDLPDLGHLPDADTLAHVPSVALFVQRARAVTPSFALSAGNARAVAEVCVRLDGLPLAIELAAARTKLLPVEAILGRLERRLEILTTGARDQPDRHRTLRAAIAWSYDLLTAEEQALFRRLAVFAGGCTSAAAEAVGGTAELGLDVLDGLASLVDKNLLRRDDRVDGEARYRMLETVREFGLDQLAACGEAPDAHRRHCEYFVALAEQAEPRLRSDQDAWLPRLQREHDNLRAALSWGLAEAPNVDCAVRLAGAVWWFWWVNGHVSEGRGWLAAALAAPGIAPPAARARALAGAGALGWIQGDYDAAIPLLGEAEVLARRVGDVRMSGEALGHLAAVFHARDDAERAVHLWEECLARYRSIEYAWGVSLALYWLGRIAREQGDPERAATIQEESLALRRAIGDIWGMGWSLRELGLLAYARDDLSQARVLLEEGLALHRRLDHRRGMAWALYVLGRVALAQADRARAASLLRESLTLRRELGDRRGLAECLEGLSVLGAAVGQSERAVTLLGAAEALREAIGAPHLPDERTRYDRDVAMLRARLDEATVARAWVIGRSAGLEPALADALELATALTGGPPPAQAADPWATDGRGGGAARDDGRSVTVLTAREREVATLVGRGLSNRQIAEALVITNRTAENHVAHILTKLDLTSRAQIAAWAAEQGLLSIGGAAPSARASGRL